MRVRSVNESMNSFFWYVAVYSVANMMTMHFDDKGWIQVMLEFGLRFAWGLVISLPSGIAWMFGQDLYIYFRIKRKNKKI